MPAYSRITELQLRLADIERRIDQLEIVLSRINDLRADCVRGSKRDRRLWLVYNRLDDHIDELNILWQNTQDELERVYNA